MFLPLKETIIRGGSALRYKWTEGERHFVRVNYTGVRDNVEWVAGELLV